VRLAASLAFSPLALAPLVGGCVEQTLTVDSNPPGAVVYLNDQEVGRTPMTVDFKWHGWYDLVIRKEGYQTLKAQAPVIAPIWNWMPLDLFAELLPVRLKDAQHLHYTLQPLSGQVINPHQLVGRGEEMRTELETGVNPARAARPKTAQTKSAQTKPTRPKPTAAKPTTQPAQPAMVSPEPATATAPASIPSTQR
jgi:hypothetical protein